MVSVNGGNDVNHQVPRFSQKDDYYKQDEMLPNNSGINNLNLSNVPTQYSSSRFGNNNSRGPVMGGGLAGGNASRGANFGVLSNSSHYNNRNMSP